MRAVNDDIRTGKFEFADIWLTNVNNDNGNRFKVGARARKKSVRLHTTEQVTLLFCC